MLPAVLVSHSAIRSVVRVDYTTTLISQTFGIDDSVTMQIANEAGRSARFEHGEKPEDVIEKALKILAQYTKEKEALQIHIHNGEYRIESIDDVIKTF